MSAGRTKLLKGVTELLQDGNFLPAEGVNLLKGGNIPPKERFILSADGKQWPKGGNFLFTGCKQPDRDENH